MRARSAPPRPALVVLVVAGLLLAAFVVVAMAAPAAAQPVPVPGVRVGGHAGVVVPVATFSTDATTTVGENLVVGTPIGIGIGRPGSPWTFDLELVPLVDPDPQSVDLLVHPGLIYAAAPRLAVGVRAAFEVGGDVYGFTPLAAYRFAEAGGVGVFFEVDAPVRFATDGAGGTVSSVGVVPHVGLSF